VEPRSNVAGSDEMESIHQDGPTRSAG
jgi:hypothetical protein